MTFRLALYTRRDCCLCEEMKAIVRAVAMQAPLEWEEVDVDQSPELRERYGNEVPVLCINGRKAFKYRTSAEELKKKLRQVR